MDDKPGAHDFEWYENDDDIGPDRIHLFAANGAVVLDFFCHTGSSDEDGDPIDYNYVARMGGVEGLHKMKQFGMAILRAVTLAEQQAREGGS